MTYEHFYSKLIYCNNLPMHSVCKNINFRWHSSRDFTINKSEHILRKNLIGVSRGRPPSPRTNYFFYFMEFFRKILHYLWLSPLYRKCFIRHSVCIYLVSFVVPIHFDLVIVEFAGECGIFVLGNRHVIQLDLELWYKS